MTLAIYQTDSFQTDSFQSADSDIIAEANLLAADDTITAAGDVAGVYLTSLYENTTFGSDLTGAPFSYTSGSFTPDNNSLLVVCVHITRINGGGNFNAGDAVDQWSISGGGLTWTKLHTVYNATTNAGTDRVWQIWWSAPVTTGSSMTVTVTDSSAYNDYGDTYFFVQAVNVFDAHSTSPLGATASGTNQGTGSATITLSASPATTSVVLAGRTIIWGGSGGSATPGAGWAEIYDRSDTTNGFIGGQIQWRGNSTSTSVDWSDATVGDSPWEASDTFGAIEIKVQSASSDDRTASLTATEASDTLTSDADAIVQPELSVTEANDTLVSLPTDYTAYWALNDGSGTSATDSSGGGRTLTLFNTPTWVTGKLGSNALSFARASSEYGSGSDTGLPSGAAARTMSCWYKMASLPGAWTTLVVYGTRGSAGCFTLNTDPSNKLATTNASTDVISSVTETLDGLWHHACATYDGTNWILYRDGVQVASTTFTLNTILAGTTVYVGSNSDPGEHWDGEIDDIRIYSRALSAAEVAALAARDGPSPLTNTDIAMDADATITEANDTTTTLVDVITDGDATFYAEGDYLNPLNFAFSSQELEWWSTNLGGSPTVTVTADAATAPDGTTTAEFVEENAFVSTHFILANSDHFAAVDFEAVTDSLTSGAQHTVSVFLKPNGRSSGQLILEKATGSPTYSVGIDFNLLTGVITSTGGSETINATGIIPYPNGWYRLFMTFTMSVTIPAGDQSRLFLYMSDSNGDENYLGVAGNGMYVWGVQTLRSGLFPYSNSATVYDSPSNVDVNTNASLTATEESDRTYENSISLDVSKDFSSGSWTKTGGSVATNSTTAPDGSSTADTFTENTSTGGHAISYSMGSVTTNQVVTVSVFVKSAEASFTDILFGVSDDSNPANFWDSNHYGGVEYTLDGSYFSGPDNGDVFRLGRGVESASNGFQRLYFTFRALSNLTLYLHLIFENESYNISYTGNGTRAGYFWGAQINSGTLLSYDTEGGLWVDVGLTPDFSITEASDTVTSAADVEVFGNATITEADDTLGTSATPIVTSRVSDKDDPLGVSTPWTSTSFTPSAKSLLVVAFGVQQEIPASNPTFTVSGGGLTWTRQNRQSSNGDYTGLSEFWTAPVGDSPSSMTVTITMNNGGILSGAVFGVSVFDIQNVNTDSPTVLTKTYSPPNNSTSTDANFVESLGGTTYSTSITLALSQLDGNNFTPASGWTAVYNTTVTSYWGFIVQYRVGAISQVEHTNNSNFWSHTFNAIEIRSAAGAFTDVSMDADANITEASDTTTTLVDVITDGDLTVNEDADTLSGATLDALATASITEASDTLTGAAETATNVINAVLNATEADDTTTTDVEVVTDGDLTVTEASDTLTSDTDALVQGNASITEDSDTTTTLVDVITDGDLSITENDDSLTSAVDVNTDGDLTVTEANDTLTGDVVDGIATANITEADDTLTGFAGADTINGNATITEASDTTTTDVDIGLNPVLNATEDSDTTTTLVDVITDGDLTVNEADDTLTSDADALVSASLTVNEDADTITADADVRINPQLNVTEASDTVTSDADTVVFTNSNITTADDTLTSAVDIEVFATTNATEADDTVDAAGSGEAGNTASLIANEDADTMSSAVDVDTKATFTATTSDTLSSDVDAEVKAVMDLLYSEDNDTATSAVQAGVHGNYSVTAASDTISSSADVGLNPSLVATEADDTTTTLVDVTVFVNGTPTEAADTTTTLVDVDTKAALTATEGNDTVDAAASAQTSTFANLTVTEANDTTTTQVDVELFGNASINEAADTTTTLVDVTTSAVLTVTETDDSTTTAVKIGTNTILTIVEDSDSTSTEVDVLVRVTSSNTEDDDSIVANIQAIVNGNLTSNEEADTLEALSDKAGGDLNVTEDGDTMTGFTFTTGVSGILNVTEASDTLSSNFIRQLKRIRINAVKPPRRLIG